MSKRISSKKYQWQRGRSPVVVLLLLIVSSLILGWGMALAIGTPNLTKELVSSQWQETPAFEVANTSFGPPVPTSAIAYNENPLILAQQTLDPVPQSYELGQELYLKNCATCHIAVPPAVLPTETWRDLLQDQQHYGVQVPRLMSPSILIVWNYLRAFSRSKLPDEASPYRVRDSRYFKALHPRVKSSEPIQLSTCISCHSSANEFNFRKLSPQWQNSP